MFAVLILPAGVILAIYGLVATFSSVARRRKNGAYVSPGRGERLTAYLGVGSALLILLVLTAEVMTSESASLRFLAVFSLPAAIAATSPLFLWRTNWRGVAESAAALVMGTLIIIGGFSVGIFLIPSAILMAFAADYHRRAERSA